MDTLTQKQRFVFLLFLPAVQGLTKTLQPLPGMSVMKTGESLLNPLPEIPLNPSHPKHESRVQCHHIPLSPGATALQHRLENGLVVGQISALEGVQRSQLKTEINGIDPFRSQGSLLKNAYGVSTLKRRFIKPTSAVHHNGSVLPQSLQGFSHRVQQVCPCHTQHLTIGPQRIHQRAQKVEHSAHTEAAPQGGQVHQRGVPCGSEEKGDASRWKSLHHLSCGRRELKAQSFKHISRADLATGTAIPVLGHHCTTGRRSECNGGRNIEGVGAISARTAGIDQKALGARPR